MGIGKLVKGTRWHFDLLGNDQFGHCEFKKPGHFPSKGQQNAETADFSTQLAP